MGFAGARQLVELCRASAHGHEPVSRAQEERRQGEHLPMLGAETACPNANGDGACGRGHRGVACALCDEGFAVDANHHCVECADGSGRYLAPFAAFCAIGALLLLYFFAAAPIRAARARTRTHGIVARFSRLLLKCGCTVRTRAVVHRLVTDVVTRYVALTMHSDPYASKAFVKPTSAIDTFKVLISFLQVIGSLAAINVLWPEDLRRWIQWASGLNLELTQLPSLACMMRDVSFLQRLIGYTLGPFVVVLIMLLPWLWVWSCGAVRAAGSGPPDMAAATFQQFMSLSLFTIFFVYPPVSRLVVASFLCKHYNVGLESDVRYLDADHRLDCDSSEYTAVRSVGVVFCVVWPLGAPLFLLGLLCAYRVPQMARRKIAKCRLRSCIRFCISNARQLDMALDEAITEDCRLEDLSDGCLRQLLCAANSVKISFKPVLKPSDKFMMDVMMRFVRQSEVVSVPIEERTRQELLELLAQAQSSLEAAEILVMPLVCWDGSDGPDEQAIIQSVGLLVVAYEVQFWYWEILEMMRKLLLTAVWVTFFNNTWSTLSLALHSIVFFSVNAHAKKKASIPIIIVCQSTCLYTEYVTIAFITSMASLFLHTLAQPFVSATIDRLQTLSLACICVTQFAGIVLAAGLTSDNEETDKIMAALVVFLNILVIVLMPLSLLMTAPGLFKAIGKAQREGQQVLERMSKLPP